LLEPEKYVECQQNMKYIINYVRKEKAITTELIFIILSYLKDYDIQIVKILDLACNGIKDLDAHASMSIGDTIDMSGETGYGKKQKKTKKIKKIKKNKKQKKRNTKRKLIYK
jgi:hypothetical protein